MDISRFSRDILTTIERFLNVASQCHCHPLCIDYFLDRAHYSFHIDLNERSKFLKSVLSFGPAKCISSFSTSLTVVIPGFLLQIYRTFSVSIASQFALLSTILLVCLIDNHDKHSTKAKILSFSSLPRDIAFVY